MSDDELRIVSCRPLNPDDLTGLARTIWDQQVLYGREPKIYEGSVVGVCQTCRMRIPIGPGQQQQIATWVAAGLPHQVLCHVCTAEFTVAEADRGRSLALEFFNVASPDA